MTGVPPNSSREFSPKPEHGGFFEKRKIKKQNKEQQRLFTTLLDFLFPYLRRV